MLTDEQIKQCREAGYMHSGLLAKHSFSKSARAIEAAACAERDQRIAELEAANEAFVKRQEWWNERMVELERQLEEARKDAKPCPTCESLARAVMLDQTGRA